MMVTTGRRTLVRKLSWSRFRSRSMVLRRWQVHDSKGEFQLDVTGFGHSDVLHQARKPFMAGSDFVGSRGHVGNEIGAFLIGRGEIWIFQHEDDATHAGMNG